MKSIILILLLWAVPGYSLIELRGNFGGALPSPTDFNRYLTTQNVKETYIMGELGADVILNFPGTGLGFGARYQYSGLKLDASVTPANVADMEWFMDRYMVVGRYLFQGAGFHIGPIAAVGVTHKPRMRIKSSSGVINQYDTADTKSTSIGLESGYTFLFIRASGEAGYQYYVIENFRGPTSTLPVKIDLSGFYMMMHLGISI